MAVYDVVVLGVGGVGSAAMRECALAGLSVAGIEQFEIGHGRGSSHGETRIIRQAYFEHPDYVPLLRTAYRGWEEIEDRADSELWIRSGLLEIGPPDGVLIRGVEASVQAYDLPVSRFNRTECIAEFPQFAVPEGAVAIFEQNAGILMVESCVKAMVDQATQAGADLYAGEVPTSVELGDTCRIAGRTFDFKCKNLVIAAGAWSSLLLPFLAPSLRILRKHLYWFTTSDSRMTRQAGCPAFFYDLPDGYFYGFPSLGARGVKLAEHSGGDVLTNANEQTLVEDEESLDRVDRFASNFLSNVDRLQEHQVCMYTLSPDEHFIVDRHPEHPNVVFAAGLSGHGFKFVPALGRQLRLLLTGASEPACQFLSLSRLQS